MKNLEKASPQAKNKVYFTQGWAEELKYFDDTYDTVILGEVLEHVVDTDAVLSEIKRVLKPEGQALISVPIGKNAVRSHKRFFEQDTLTELLSQYFTVDRIEVFGTQMLAVCKENVNIPYIDDTFVFGEDDDKHEKGNTKCSAGWCDPFTNFPKRCNCGGLIHANFLNESDDDILLQLYCDKCGEDYEEV